ncbi:DUF4373 domain-containing protein [Listeria kieliensis]
MARPIKKGIDYFPLDVTFLSDIKVRKIMKACGNSSISILISLLSNIYREQGYYVAWDSDTAFLVADEVGTSEGSVEEVVKKSVQVGFFNKSMFEKKKILTSKGIQERYKTAAYKKKDNGILPVYDLSTSETKSDGVSDDGNPVSDIGSTQSKGKESKVNKSKTNTPDLQNDFLKLWNLYPRKERKADAFKAYKKAVKEGVTNKEIQDGIVLYKQHIQVKNTEHQFIAQGGTWFNQRRWNDEYDLTPETKSNGSFRKNTKQEVLPEWFDKQDQELEQEKLKESDSELAKQADMIKERLRRQREARQV